MSACLRAGLRTWRSASTRSPATTGWTRRAPGAHPLASPQHLPCRSGGLDWRSSENRGWEEVEADAAAAYESAAGELGAEPLALGSPFAEARAVHLGIMRREVAHAFAPWVARGEAALSDTVRGHIEGGRAIDADAYLSLLDEADAMRRAFERALKPYDAALTPAAPGGAPEGLDFTGSRTQTMLWTMLGVPAINVPALAVGGLPLGLQVVGRFGADATTLRAAAWCAARLQDARQ